MNEDLLALAGDLASERKKLSDNLRQLEGKLLRADTADNVRGIHDELEGMAQGLERLGALASTLVYTASHERLVPASDLISKLSQTIKDIATQSGRPVEVHAKHGNEMIDSVAVARIRPVLEEMIRTFLEYAPESEKERALRGKRLVPHVQIEMRAANDAHCLVVFCDGNGVEPPLVEQQGIRLARVGARAVFEGKPGKWSAWRIYLPSDLGPTRFVPVRAKGRTICVPGWAVVSVGASFAGGVLWGLSDQVERSAVPGISEGQVVVEFGAGTATARYVFDQVLDSDEFFMKPLHADLSGKGRFLGVIQHQAQLCLVLNPAFLVYGEEGLA